MSKACGALKNEHNVHILRDQTWSVLNFGNIDEILRKESSTNKAELQS